MKKCRFCAEEIQDDAIKCRFCGEFLKKKNKWLNCLFGCFLSVIISILLFILFLYLSFFLLKFIIYRMFFCGASPQVHNVPFTGQGIEGMAREFGEAFKALWGSIADFFRGNFNNSGITF